MRHIKRLFTGLWVLLFALPALLAGCGGAEETKGKATEKPDSSAEQIRPLDTTSTRVVAEYEGGKVTEGELNLYLNILQFLQPNVALFLNNSDAKKQVVKQMIGERLIVAKVKEEEPYAKRADQAMKEIENLLKNQPPQGKSFDERLKEKGFNKEQLRQFFINSNKVTAYFEKQVSEKDLQAEYNRADQFLSVKVQHILVSTEKRSDAEAKKRAEEVKRKLEKGGDFAKLAKEYSDDTGSKDQGGVIEGSPDQFVPEFAQAARTLPLNRLSDPIKTVYGYHVMKVMERKKLPYEQVKDQIKQDRVQKLYQAFIEKQVKVKRIQFPEGNNK